MTTAKTLKRSMLAHDLFLFCCAVLLGTAAGVVTQQLLREVLSPQAAMSGSVAMAATSTGAAHSRFVHRKRIAELVPNVVAGAPLAYLAMRAIHFLAGF